MTRQLRLVEAPEARRPARTGRRPVRYGDWRLDARARQLGRQGVARARAALARATEGGPDLPKAS